MANTYLETVDDRADNIHLAIRRVPMSAVYYEYLKTLQIMDRRSNFSAHDAVLAFDCTDEDFYGRLNGIWMHAWTGEHAVTGKFRFLTCSLVSHDVPEKVPLLSIPVHAGNNMAVDVCYCLSLVRPLLRSVRLVLFDRGFHNNELMLMLSHMSIPYLLFLRKTAVVKRELAGMLQDERKTVDCSFSVNVNKTVLKGETTVPFLRKIFEKILGKRMDWCFATNRQEIDLDSIVQAYRGRWNMERGFRVQDEATIRSKSKDVKIRFFLFAYEQELQLIWSVFYREDVPFKQFLLQLSETCTGRLRRAEERAANREAAEQKESDSRQPQ